MICLQDNKHSEQLAARISSVYPNSIKKTSLKNSNIFLLHSHFLLGGPIPETFPYIAVYRLFVDFQRLSISFIVAYASLSPFSAYSSTINAFPLHLSVVI